ncbi:MULTISPECIES: phage holin family protein [Paenibacillus]|uniref:phage holin family protein n=1 Tax=Paenibacillus TaxID=44249 RepID=UPI0022B880C5|nr:phage holin family protein [Paenibacillus caseinilyticus]MCZ8520110.1 phage holin family protein [Paenibacillus caseinilyticus]
MTIKDMTTMFATAALGDNLKEFSYGSVVAAAGFVGSNYLGGWDKALQFLVVAMIADYITGILGAVKTKSVNSEVMFWGGIRKGVVIGVIALAAICDQWVGGENPVFRMLALYFYGGREGLSVVENLGKIGVPLPGSLTKFLEQLKQKGDAVQ